jgi:glycolate oxidase FAD binding subunit
MANILQPETPDQVAEALAWAAAESMPVEVLGRGTKRDLGRPLQTEYRLDLSKLAGVSLYEPEELVMTARAGTPLAEIQAALAEKRQQLAFEPADLGPLYGGPANAGSIGGVFACNLAGPRRFKAGAARDHLLGFKAVSGRGEAFKSGGRVVKNVTGFDLCKLLTGSYGTLAALTEVTFKVLPVGDKTRTVLLFGLGDKTAITLMAAAASSPHEISGIAHVPHAVARQSAVNIVARSGANVTALRVEGPAPSVATRVYAINTEFGKRAAFDEISSHASGIFWGEVRDAKAFGKSSAKPLWRLSVPPASGATTVAGLREAGLGDMQWFYDQAGGLIWLQLGGEAEPDIVRAVVRHSGGHATLLRAAPAVRAAVPVFQPQDAALAALTARVKESFDPQHVLNPGRMYAGI